MHSYHTRSVSSEQFYIKPSRLDIQKLAFSRSGTSIWNSLPVDMRHENKLQFKKHLRELLRRALKERDDYIDVTDICTWMSNLCNN